ncbi:MAG: NAD(+)/NADH kinase [Gemmatimonadota bacterium]
MRLGVLANPAKDGLEDVVAELRRSADALGFQLVVGPELSEYFASEEVLESAASPVDTLLTLGGDGTLLRGAQIAGPLGIPVLGCNLGQLGFLTAGARSELGAMLQRLAGQDFHEEERTALDIEVQTDGSSEDRDGGATTLRYALNDAVVHQTGLARLIRLHVFVDREEVGQYSADGIVISSATGSTAYSLSAGGPILVPTLDALVATPICPHSLAIRPLVVPSTSVIRVEVVSKAGARVSADGQAGDTIQAGDAVTVRRSEHSVRLIRMEEQGFFRVLSQKLRWGDVRPAREDA